MSHFSTNGSFANLLKDGFKHYTGAEESILKNIDAIKELGSMTRTSYGPNGMNKFIVNQLEKLFLTKDSGIMLREVNKNLSFFINFSLISIILLLESLQIPQISKILKWEIILI
jgi:hypothetical protein